jgi:hypothetical protein
MRVTIGLFAFALTVFAQEPARRYGVEADLKTFPQTTPKEALASVLKAVAIKRFDYVAAQLADPDFIDDQVQRLYGGRFTDQVEATQTQLDPARVKLLQRFLEEGEFLSEKERTTVRLKDVKDSVVRLKQSGGRWYLEHASKP